MGLIGRHSELASARTAVRSGNRGVLVTGEPGVGKTSLARAVLAELAMDAGNEILWLVPPDAEPSIAFAAFAPFVPEIGGKPGRQPDPFFLLQVVRNAVLERAAGRRLVLGIDDAHRLDGYSATLVFQLVEAHGTRVVAAVQARAKTPAAIRSLWKEDLVTRIDLDPLGRDDSIEFVEQLLAGPAAPAPVGGELAEALWRVSGGNPLYLRELVLAGRHSGRIVKEEDVWRLSGELEVGPRLTELLQERLGHLSDAELAALETVAFADPLPLPVLTRVAPAGSVAALQKAGLLKVERSQGEHVARTGHPLYAEAVRATIPTTRASELCLALADAFEADGRRPTNLLRIVTWRLDGGDQPPPADLVAASLRAAERQDWSLSLRLAEAAVAAGGGPEALFAQADALRTLGRFEDALAALGAHEGEGDDQVARVAVLRAAVLVFGLGRYQDAQEALGRALSRIDNTSNHTWVEAVQAGLLNFAGRAHDAIARTRPLLDRPNLSSRTDAAVRAALGLGLAWSGRAEEALAVLDGGLEPPGSEAGNWVSRGWAKTARALALRLSGGVAELDELAGADYRLAAQLNDRPGQARAACAMGWTALAQGRLALAASRFREAAGDVDRADFLSNRLVALTGLAEALALSGDVAGAEAALAAARSHEDRSTSSPSSVSSASSAPTIALAAAWVAAAQGAVTEALALLDRAAVKARARDQTAFEVMVLHAAVRLGSPHVAKRLAVLNGRAEGCLTRVVAAHAAALAAPRGAGEALDEISSQYASMSLELYAAEASAQASREHRLAGNARRAAASAARAHFLLGGSDGTRPLALTLALSPPGLTRRESEVAHLALQGLSSQAIATRLSLSVRTVETHLARVYFKLGISRRGELASAMRPDAGAEAHVEAHVEAG